MSRGTAASAVVYLGLVLALAGLFLVLRPIPMLGVNTRSHAGLVLVLGAAIALTGLVFPAGESRVQKTQSRLDEAVPAWQFNEHHSMEIAAPPERVFEAIRQVRGDEIALLHVLTWIRRGGRPIHEGVLNPGKTRPFLEVALRSGFRLLADEAPREVVLGMNPIPGTFAALNFLVHPSGAGSTVSTETRIFASDPRAKRIFAGYWRLIYPGSALLRRTWLRAIRKRATSSQS